MTSTIVLKNGKEIGISNEAFDLLNGLAHGASVESFAGCDVEEQVGFLVDMCSSPYDDPISADQLDAWRTALTEIIDIANQL